MAWGTRRGAVSRVRPLVALGATLLALSCGGGGGGGGGSDPGGYVPDPEMPGQGLDLLLFEEGDLILTALDDQDRLYSFFGERDPDGRVARYTQLSVHRWYPDDTAEHYLTIDFDEHQRPVRASLTNTGETLSLRYLSDLDVEATVTTWTGHRETLVVANPYGLGPGGKPYAGDGEPGRRATLGQKAVFSGWIKGCGGDVVPQVMVRRRSIDTPRLPSAVILPRVEAWSDPEGWTHRFSYTFEVPNPVFAEWRSACIEQKLRAGARAGVDVAAPYVGAALSVWELSDAIVQDYRQQTTSNASREVVEELLDRLGDEYGANLPLSFYVEALAEYLSSSGEGPCSEFVWSFKRRVALATQDVFCLYGNVQKSSTFTPPPFPDPDSPDDVLRAVAGDFDFTAECCEAVPDKLWVTCAPKDPPVGGSVTVTATMIPPVEGCELRFHVQFTRDRSDYWVTRTTDANGRVQFVVSGTGSPAGSKGAAQVTNSPVPVEYDSPDTNSVYWEY